MMEDIYKGKIQGVITKRYFPVWREHIETSNYIERVFPSLGVRYIAILDGVILFITVMKNWHSLRRCLMI